ncbi:uncharacterized protein SPPG_04891 [Spizellomyces punctatus DAOM BR117]|uniref:Mid2 domain-containing protein n=1 Tax=Spizellomyces punctatus (strain DAOM BR117) TaxID=645134 RepID=A0A0L0HEP6_SPIPD|nr:uncharacterized protein SPPG_04891 [Spizellomyces punctatus DAOM BR117]KNC99496.1 hypothetical protein SPPG_04891 [Spizellomyces punctatus DAOM BR117]|eukprot:XP_016607536.1 hypothetical protein SPPG_04891 [Spizellomyces punctatus DAOM BR117]
MSSTGGPTAVPPPPSSTREPPTPSSTREPPPPSNTPPPSSSPRPSQTAEPPQPSSSSRVTTPPPQSSVVPLPPPVTQTIISSRTQNPGPTPSLTRNTRTVLDPTETNPSDAQLLDAGDGKSKGFPVGAGVGIGVVAAGFLIAIVGFIWIRKRRDRLTNTARLDFNNPDSHGSLWRQESGVKPAVASVPIASAASNSAATSAATLAAPAVAAAGPGMTSRPSSMLPTGAYYGPNAYDGYYAQQPQTYAYYDAPNTSQVLPYGYYPAQGYEYADPYYGHQYAAYAPQQQYADMHPSEPYDPNSIDAHQFPEGTKVAGSTTTQGASNPAPDQKKG